MAIPPPPYIEPIENEVVVQKVNLKGYSSYKLNELQELATQYNINIKLDNDKKKTKKQLYDDLKLI